ncbi:MAG: molecular chaperone HtpG [Culicoidibacterales bacterium]
MKKTKKFKAESKQLLELMIHSIYSNKEIFLRELISNASDALDKRHFYSLQNEAFTYDELKIAIHVDTSNRTITLEDTGIGMSEEDLNNNLGVIAHSGSKEFAQQLAEEDQSNPADIIGQFGVGFYSSFIVADKVTVHTKTVGTEGLIWTSTGEESYTIDAKNKAEIGTAITLHIREGEVYDEFLVTAGIQGLVKKYSDYIKYPIYMDVTRQEPELDADGEVIEGKYKAVVAHEIVNSQVAIWKRDKKDVTKEEYESFYMSEFHEYQKPLHVIHSAVEGQFSYHALLFIPTAKSYDFYQPSFQKGLELFSKGVLIEEKCEGLISDAFRFVRGLVDSADISLNISREMLQQDTQVEKIAKSLETKIKNELAKMQKKDRLKYNDFYKEFGMQLMYGLYDNYGAKKDLLKDLIMFKTSKSEEFVTLKEYVQRMKEDQKSIYFAVGESTEQISKLPQMEQILEQDIEVLYFLNDVDEFAIKVLTKYEDKEFQSITQGNFDFSSDEQKKELDEKQVENKNLLEKIQEELKGSVDEVRLTSRLKNSAVCLVGGEGLSLEMEKILQAMPDGGANMGMKAQKILEINPEHALFKALETVLAQEEDKLSLYANLLYQQALLIEGLPLADPVAYANQMSELMIAAVK